MLETFDNTNEMLLAAVQELTTELATAQGKIAELEKGGGGGGNIAYIETALIDNVTYISKINNVQDVDFTKPIQFIQSYNDSGFTTNTLIKQMFYSEKVTTDISTFGINNYIDQGEFKPISGTKTIIATDLIRETANHSQSGVSIVTLPFAGLLQGFNALIIDTETGNFLYSIAN